MLCLLYVEIEKTKKEMERGFSVKNLQILFVHMKSMTVDGIGNMMKLELMLGAYLHIYECLNVDVLYKYMYVCV